MLKTPDRLGFHHSPLVFLLLLAGLTGCASTPPQSRPSSAIYRPVLDVAIAQLGAPYRYGGTTPRGFDCSGLVYYVYRRVGIQVPRSAREQYRFAQPVPLDELLPGDLVFFKRTFHSVSHVGIYAGNARFIHAPSKGRAVSYDSLNNPYWKARLVAAGRYD